MSWAEDKALELSDYCDADVQVLVARAIRETIEKCAEEAA